MGQLVFQAALGGQTNLVGANTASTYNINVPAVNGTFLTQSGSEANGTLLIGNGSGYATNTLTAGSNITITNGSGTITIASTGAPATSGTSILYGNGSGGFSNVTVGSGLSFAGGTLTAQSSTSVGLVRAISINCILP